MRRIINTPACPADLKYANRFQVIGSFLDGRPHSANDVAYATGLSRQTVKKSIQFFLDGGLLISDGKGDSTIVGGKRPELFALSRNRYFLCITLWPLEQHVRLITIGNQPVDTVSMAEPMPDNPEAAIDHLGTLAAALLERNHLSRRDLCAVSLSTAGTLDYKAGCLKYSSQSPDWGTNVPVAAYLRKYVGPDVPIFLENAGKMTARPFLLEPELENKRVLVLFTCWGLSSCLIEKGRILSGKNSLIGEIGHMIIAPDDPEPCGCGSHGCLERLVSSERIQALIRKERYRFPNASLLRLPLESLTLRDVFDASAGCDPLARHLVDYLAQNFATALRNICLVFDPDLIVFQGDYAYADPYFDVRLRKWLKEFQYFPADGPFEIRYDRRSLTQMEAQGSFIALVRYFFDSPELYKEPPAEIAPEQP